MGRLLATPAKSVKRESISWLWPGRIPAIGLTILAGDPGLGKSMLTVRLAAELGYGRLDGESGVTLMATAEDSWGAVLKPRLEAAGAALETVAFIGPDDPSEPPLSLPDDVDELDLLVAEHQARLVVIDPLMAFLPESVNSWRDQSVRRALAPLHALADRHACAVLCVVHLNKAMGADPLQRTGGSVGIPGAARSALLFARDPEDPEGDAGSRRVLAQFKSNYGKTASSLQFKVDAVCLPGDDEATPRMVEVGESNCGARSLLSAPGEEEKLERDEAVDFLRVELASGRRASKDVKNAARDAGISDTTLKRARKELGVVTRKDGLNGGWYVELPEEDPEVVHISTRPTSKGATVAQNLTPFDERGVSETFGLEEDHQAIDDPFGVEVWDYT